MISTENVFEAIEKVPNSSSRLLIASKVLGKSNWSMVVASLRPVLLIILLGFIFQEISLPSISQTNEENKLIKQK